MNTIPDKLVRNLSPESTLPDDQLIILWARAMLTPPKGKQRAQRGVQQRAISKAMCNYIALYYPQLLEQSGFLNRPDSAGILHQEVELYARRTLEKANTGAPLAPAFNAPTITRQVAAPEPIPLPNTTSTGEANVILGRPAVTESQDSTLPESTGLHMERALVTNRTPDKTSESVAPEGKESQPPKRSAFSHLSQLSKGVGSRS